MPYDKESNRKKHNPAVMPGMATLADVALAAGVSRMSVSNVVNGRFDQMKPGTRQRIEQALEELGYRRQASARSLKLAKRLVIGMMIVDESRNYLADPYITHVVAGFSNFLGERGYGLLLQGVRAKEAERCVFLTDARADGICVLMHGSLAMRRRLLAKLDRLNEPVVVLQEPKAITGKDVCRIRQDDAAGGYAIAEHLLGKGVRRFLVMVPELEWPAVGERVRALKRAATAVSGTSVSIVSCGDARFASTQDALSEALTNGLPDAVVASNDQMGIAALKLLRQNGYRVPEDVLVTGYNGFEFWQFTDPVLTTVLAPAYETGERAAAELLARLSEGSFSTQDIVLPVQLQLGGST